ncbi:unnamed protein product [Prunus armeniaca]
MDATKVLGQADMAKLESSYQALPSSLIALRSLRGLIRRKVILPQGWEGISATPWLCPERRIVVGQKEGENHLDQATMQGSVDIAQPWFWRSYKGETTGAGWNEGEGVKRN